MDGLKGEIIVNGETIRVARLVFGVGTTFHFSRTDRESGVVVGDHLLERYMVGKIAERDFCLNIITARKDGVVSIELLDGDR
jgi:hypothetical protein